MRLTKAASLFVLLLLAVPFALLAENCPPAGSLSFPFTLNGSQFRGQGSSSASGNGSTIGVHSNIGLFNPNPVAVTVQLNLGSAQGAAIGSTANLQLQPYQMIQLPLLGGTNVGLFSSSSDVADAVVRFQASAPIFAYSSITNNASADTHVVFAKEDPSSPATATSDIAAIVLAANQGEVDEGQFAISHASSAAVQQFARQMVTDHSNALAQAQSMFGSNAITVSTNNATAQFLQSETQQEIASLNNTPFSQFDRAYIQNQVDAQLP